MPLQVDYTDTFRLFCTTRLPNPHYTPELSAKVTLVDFTVTMAGLEDQLLGKLILKEKHELEEQRQGLMEEVQSYKKKIKQLEDDLLFRLSNSQVGQSSCSCQMSCTVHNLMIMHPMIHVYVAHQDASCDKAEQAVAYLLYFLSDNSETRRPHT